jgi:hypothetical protein
MTDEPKTPSGDAPITYETEWPDRDVDDWSVDDDLFAYWDAADEKEEERRENDDLFAHWDAADEKEEERRENDMLREALHPGPQPTWGVFKPSQGIVRILGNDKLALGMSCDVEHGYRREAVEVEIVDIHPFDKRLVTVERVDGKRWEHHKEHTRIVKP